MTDENTPDPGLYLEKAAEIVAAYVSHNSLQQSELSGVIQLVHSALVGLGNGGAAPEVAVKKEPAAPIKKSVTPNPVPKAPFTISSLDDA